MNEIDMILDHLLYLTIPIKVLGALITFDSSYPNRTLKWLYYCDLSGW